MSTYTAINLVARPEPGPITPDLFEIIRHEVPQAGPGQVLVKQTHMSLDPAARGFMAPDEDSYMPPVALGEVMRSSGMGEIVETNNPDFKIGDRVMGLMGWTEFYLGSGEGLRQAPEGMDAEMALSVFALPGLTATQGLYGFSEPKAGETLLVTGAAGSVGSLVGQMAKADGLTVVGVAGSEEKCRWLTEELGFDGAINYKTDALDTRLAELAPNGVDMYFENTGGPIQQHVFDRMNAHGRIVVCGMIADYNAAVWSPGPNWIPIIKKRLSIQGYAMTDHYAEIPSLMEKLASYVMAGKIKHRAHILDGLESAIDGLNLLFTGGNNGKLIVKL
ncbi:MAG: NADP-dependent oxidoreductase [Halioglobus sp.]